VIPRCRVDRTAQLLWLSRGNVLQRTLALICAAETRRSCSAHVVATDTATAAAAAEDSDNNDKLDEDASGLRVQKIPETSRFYLTVTERNYTTDEILYLEAKLHLRLQNHYRDLLRSLSQRQLSSMNEHLYSPKAEIQFMRYNMKYSAI